MKKANRVRILKKSIMAVKIRLQQSKFKEENRGGKWHARTVSNGVSTIDDLADAIQESTSFTRGDVRGIVMALIDEIGFQLANGKTVALDGLGRFHLTVESIPSTTPEDFSLRKNVKGIKCKFVPSGRRDPDTNRKVEDFGFGVQVVWADKNNRELK